MPNAQNQPVIAVDGTSASGKSTLCQRLADDIGGVRLEYSLVFRAIGHHMYYKESYDPEFGHTPSARQIAAAVAYAKSISAMPWEEFTATIKDNPSLRSIETSRTAPFFAGLPDILDITDTIFRELIERCPKPVVAEGRTIGRYVYPQADTKLFVDATLYRRAERRHADLYAKGKAEPFEVVLADLARRDHQDQTREHQPTTFDPSAQYWLDTTIQTIDDTLIEANGQIKNSMLK
jgi:cytidylate kinase